MSKATITVDIDGQKAMSVTLEEGKDPIWERTSGDEYYAALRSIANTNNEMLLSGLDRMQRAEKNTFKVPDSANQHQGKQSKG